MFGLSDLVGNLMSNSIIICNPGKDLDIYIDKLDNEVILYYYVEQNLDILFYALTNQRFIKIENKKITNQVKLVDIKEINQKKEIFLVGMKYKLLQMTGN